MRRGARGNIFAMLFAAVALTGVLASVGMQTLTGPVTTITRVTQKNIADTQLLMNAKIIISAAVTGTLGGDADTDGIIEPAAYVAAGGGETPPVGGGYLPTTLGLSLTDPWGTKYGYCVWDHGTTNSSASRLDGDNTGSAPTQPVIAVIAAGPDKAFQTTCSAYSSGPISVTKGAGSDDLILKFSYNEASASSNGLWTLNTSDQTKAELKDSGGTANVTIDRATGIGDFAGITTSTLAAKTDNVAMDGGLKLDTSANVTACAGGSEGVLRYNSSTNKLEVCNGTAWKPAGDSDATYITQTPSPDLANEQALSALATGVMKVTTGTGVISSGAVDLSGTEATGILADARFPELTGEVTTTAGSVATTIADNVIDFSEMKDAMTLDASTDISATGANELSVTNSGTGLSLRVNDEASDTTPFVIDADGKVGIGTANPSQSLSVVGKTGYYISNTLRGLIGPPAWDDSYFSFQNGTLPELAANSALNQNSVGDTIVNAATGRTLYFRVGNDSGQGQFQMSAGKLAYTNGNMGIGTSDPKAKLDISGGAKVGADAVCNSDRAGMIAWNSNLLQVCDGTSFKGINAIEKLDDIGDVDATAPGDNQILAWDAGSNRWVAKIVGAVGNATISVPGNDGAVQFKDGSSLAADQSNFHWDKTNHRLGIGTAAPIVKLDVAGEIKLGSTGIACSAATEGVQRYNPASKTLEFCDGTAWSIGACTDTSPDAFFFTDLTGQPPSTLILSDIVQVTGMGCAVSVSVSGTGSPAYRICDTSDCSTVAIDWKTGSDVVEDGQYVQLRMTTSSSASYTNTATFSAGAFTDSWSATTLADCSGSPAPGTVCADGSVYAGLSPDGNLPMFTTRCDFGMTWDGTNCTGSRASATWNNGSGTWLITGIASTTKGRYNTTALAGSTDGASPYQVAQQCENLVINGKSDWYLPASAELSVMANNLTAIGNFASSNTNYWSSSENGATYGWFVQFPSKTISYANKNTSYNFRCARKDMDIFDFEDVLDQPLNTQVTSAIKTITGIASGTAVSITGSGSPQISINGGAWATSGTIDSGQTLQLRLTSSASTATSVSSTVTLGSLTDTWAVKTVVDCSGSVPAGSICQDGTIYVGNSTDGNFPMYATRCDYGQTWDGTNCAGTATLTSWNNATGSWTTTGVISGTKGRQNTNTLAALVDAGSPHQAATFCSNLVTNGHDDWYLPALNEALAMAGNAAAAKTFPLNNTAYWTSTEHTTNTNAYYVGIPATNSGSANKNALYRFRCVRTDYETFDFKDTADAQPSSLTTSEIITLNSVPANTSVSITGSGSPQISINGGAWATSGTIDPGQTLRLRLTSSATPLATVSTTVTVGSLSDTWAVTTSPGCSGGSTPIGTVCNDGTIYAGLTPDGNFPMYTTRCDYGQTWDGASCTGSITTAPWNNASGNWTTTGYTSTSKGKANTSGLVNVSDTASPYQAATLCSNLVSDGKTDWYLPALNEALVLSTNAPAIKNFPINNTVYWTSTEHATSNAHAYYMGIPSTSSSYAAKNASYRFRCVRTDFENFDFRDTVDALPSTVTISEVITLNAISNGTAVSISGSGSPELSINGGAWTTSGTMNPGQTLRLRLTSSATPLATLTATVTVGSQTDSWSVTTQAGCTGASTVVGTVCSDGTVFAGISPDGNFPMYTTRCDYGQVWDGSACTGSPTATAWNNASSNWTTTGFTSTTKGKASTAGLMGWSDTASPYIAANNCGNLVTNGHDDWYLPALNEALVLSSGAAAIKNFPVSSTAYWTTTEHLTSNPYTYYVGIPSNTVSFSAKNAVYRYRCVRTDFENFDFRDTVDALPSTVTISEVITLNAISNGTAVSISGSGSPELSINGGAWATSGTMNPGQTLRLRLTSSATPLATLTATVTVGSQTDSWSVTTMQGCSGSPTAGSVCEDGTVYAGMTPDGNVKMFTTRCDYGQTWDGAACTGSVTAAAWNNGTSNWQNTGFTDTNKGNYNTAGLKARSDTASPYQAAVYCSNLVANGYDDWYLPALNESLVMAGNAAAIKNFTVNNTAYWTSTEYSGTTYSAYYMGIPSTASSYANKNTLYRFRCVRNAGLNFSDLNNQSTNLLVESQSTTLNNISSAQSVTITGAGSPEFRINGGAWGTTGTANPGDTLQLRLTTASTLNTTRSATVTVGSLTGSWHVTTFVTVVGGPGSPAAGSDKQVLFNDGGFSGADAGLTFDKTPKTLRLSSDTPLNLADKKYFYSGTVNIGQPQGAYTNLLKFTTYGGMFNIRLDIMQGNGHSYSESYDIVGNYDDSGSGSIRRIFPSRSTGIRNGGASGWGSGEYALEIVPNIAGDGLQGLRMRQIGATDQTGSMAWQFTAVTNGMTATLLNTTGTDTSNYAYAVYRNTPVFQALSKVGILTAKPVSALDVAGGARVGADAVCSASKAGMLAWNSNTLQVCTDAGTFATIASSSTSPNQWLNGGSGTIYYNGGDIGIGTSTPNLGAWGTGQYVSVYSLNKPGVLELSSTNVANGAPAGRLLFTQQSFGSGQAAAIDAVRDVGNGQLALRFTAGGSERLRITKDGNIGIGTTSPEARVDIIGAQQGDVTTLGSEVPAAIIQQRTGGPGNDYSGMLEFRNDNGAVIWTAGSIVGRAHPSYGGGLSFFTQPGNISNDPPGRRVGGAGLVERLTISSNGKIGIGTTTTTPSYLLSLSGNAAQTVGMERHTTADTAGNSLTVLAGGATSGATDKNGGDLVLSSGTATGTGTSKIEFKTHPAGSTGTADTTAITRMAILGNGNVGIGTVTPSFLTEIAGPASYASVAGAVPLLRLRDTNAPGTKKMDFNPNNFSISTGQAGDFFASMRLNGNGLSVYNESGGTSVLTGAIRSDGSVNTNMVQSGGLLGVTYSPLTLRSNYYGISTATPAINFQVFRTSGAANDLSKIAIYNGDDGPIIMQSNGLANVGIGSTSLPVSKLDVAGGARVGADAVCSAAKAGMLAWNSDTLQICSAAGTFINLAGAGGGAAAGDAGYVQVSDGNGGFTTSGTTAGQEFFWDNTNKRLGIGTATPGNTLDVNGVLGIRNGLGGGTITSPSSNALQFSAAGGFRFTGGRIYLGSTYSGGTPTIYTTSDNDVSFGPNGTTKVTIRTDTGYVGIGTTSPATALHLADSTSTPTLTIAGATGGSNIGTYPAINFTSGGYYPTYTAAKITANAEPTPFPNGSSISLSAAAPGATYMNTWRVESGRAMAGHSYRRYHVLGRGRHASYNSGSPAGRNERAGHTA